MENGLSRSSCDSRPFTHPFTMLFAAKKRHKILLLICAVMPACPMGAEHAYASESVNTSGLIGLNTTPTARMADAGDVRMGTGFNNPYLHGFAGVQISDTLYIGVRQSADTLQPPNTPTTFTPGIDTKIRLLQEGQYSPQIAIGMQSAIGDSGSAREFITLSKRYKNADFTLGLGWGRMGSAAHLDNPLKIFGDHFDQRRTHDAAQRNNPSQWFTGEDIGIFGGVEYFLPYQGLSLKLDYGADRYILERKNSEYTSRAPWAVGLSYSPRDWINTGVGMQGLDHIMATLTLRGNPKSLPLRKGRTHDAMISYDDNIAHITAPIDAHNSAPHAASNTIYEVIQHAPQEVKTVDIHFDKGFITTPRLTVLRKDLDAAVTTKQGSPQEIWQNMTISAERAHYASISPIETSLTLENTIDFSGHRKGISHHSALIGGIKHRIFRGINLGAAARFDLGGNANQTQSITNAKSPFHNNEAFREKRFGIENAYLSIPYSLNENTHILLQGGYLEQRFTGYSGEILYRPFESRLALGAQIASLYKRDPHTTMESGIHKDERYDSGFANLWYDMPHHDMTLNLRAGRFIAGDYGGEIGVSKIFMNGAKINASIAISNNHEQDTLTGHQTNTSHMLALSIPLGAVKYTPDQNIIRTTIMPLDLNIAQRIDMPNNLYAITNNISMKHIADHWEEIEPQP